MNGYAKCMALLLVIIAVLFACSSAPKFSNVMDKDWKLIAVRGSPESITFNRNKLVEEGFSDIFTLRFDKERVNGVGAPNRYFAPYTLVNKQDITIKTIAQSQMAPLREPEYLKEYEFFAYLQKTTKWNVTKEGNLELYSKGADGTETILVFVP